MKHRPREVFESLWTSLPHSLQRLFSFLSDFITAPFIGSVIGVILGTIPALHTAFFAPSHDGGIFTAWLTLSIKNLGQLFASLQILVVGIKLSASLNKMRRGEESGPVPWPIFVGVTAIRYFVWPCASIGIVWAVVGKLGLGSRDPILWFVLMMIPSGPPAMKLGALADVSNGTEQEKLSIAKFLAISYTLCPLISASIVGALRTCEAMREIQ
ncbi:hypothetical protein DL96DRAFT_1128759 [Flagelloscypha sp. PMI_526]|nr:hypothetical protein DL96DRAFT_1128759 [Flagelloscypha sp. PMI_526]